MSVTMEVGSSRGSAKVPATNLSSLPISLLRGWDGTPASRPHYHPSLS